MELKGCKCDNPTPVEMDLEAGSADLEKLISGEVDADGGQSASETGALRLPSVGTGLVLTNEC